MALTTEAKLQLPFGARQMGALQDHFDYRRTVEMLNFAKRNDFLRFSSKIGLIAGEILTGALHYCLTLFTLLCLLRVCPRCFRPLLIGNSAQVLITCLLPSLSPWWSGLVATPWATVCLWNPSDDTFLHTPSRCLSVGTWKQNRSGVKIQYDLQDALIFLVLLHNIK